MTKREKSRIAFAYAVVTAIAVTCIVLYSLMAGLAWSQVLLLMIGCLFVLWAIVFTFFEVGRLAGASKKAGGPTPEGVDPDSPRRVIVEPPTGHPYPHHEDHAGSAGLDQGQLTSRLPGATPFIDELLDRRRRKEQETRR